MHRWQTGRVFCMAKRDLPCLLALKMNSGLFYGRAVLLKPPVVNERGDGVGLHTRRAVISSSRPTLAGPTHLDITCPLPPLVLEVEVLTRVASLSERGHGSARVRRRACSSPHNYSCGMWRGTQRAAAIIAYSQTSHGRPRASDGS